MRLKGRLAKLEKAAGGKADPVIVVVWDCGDGTLEANGEIMTREELDRRWPAATEIRLTWGDDGDG